MPERALAGGSHEANGCGVTVLDDSRVLVSGAWHCADETETTVALAAEVFDRAARERLRRRRGPWRRMVPQFLGWAAVATAATFAAMGLGASPLAANLVDLVVCVVAGCAVGWREAGRDA